MAMPFLALHLQIENQTDPLMIGLIIGIGPLAGFLMGFLLGHLSDRIGRVHIMQASLLLWTVTFLGFACAQTPLHFMMCNIFNGIARAIFEPMANAFMSDLTIREKRRSMYHFRYYLINIGGAIGPLVGVLVLKNQAQIGFLITACMYFLQYVGFILLSRKIRFKEQSNQEKEKIELKTVVRILSRDFPYTLFILGSLCMLFTYTQLDSTFPQFLNKNMKHNGIMLYGTLLSLNGLTIVIFQYLITRWTKRFRTFSVITVGALIYGLGYFGFIFAGTNIFVWLFSMVILTLGEVIGAPNENLLIDEMAPERFKGAYFGASNLRSLGFMFGPIVGGYLLKEYNYIVLLQAMCMVTLIAILFFVWGNSTFVHGVRKNETPYNS